MIQIRAFVLTACLALLAAAGTAWGSSEDMPGSRDFEGLPRVDGTHIAGYLYSEYDAGRFVTRTDDRNRAVLARPEGKRTRIIYLGRESQTPLQLMRNYQKAFEAFGDYEELYSCTGEACDRNLASGVLWAEDNRIKTSFRNPYSLYLGRYTDVRYVYGTLYKGEKVYHVSVFSNFQKGGQTGILRAQSGLRGRR